MEKSEPLPSNGGIVPVSQELSDLVKDKCFINPTIEYPDPTYTLFRKGKGLLQLGAVHEIKAHKKSGKTYACSIYAASVLGCTSFGFTANPDIKNPRVLYFDTEQPIPNTARIQKRMVYLLHRKPLTYYSDFFLFNIKFFSKAERLQYVTDKIRALRPTFVVIDGIVDLCADWMNNVRSEELVGFLSNLAEEMNCCILNVLHMNKSKDDMNSRGALGTELDNRACNIQSVEKKNGVITVSDDESRDGTTEPWSFAIDNDFMPLPTETQRENKELAKLAKMGANFKAAFLKLNTTEASAVDLVRQYKLEAVIGSDSGAYKHLRIAKEEGILIPTENGYKLSDSI